jgi:hypothetical protein
MQKRISNYNKILPILEVYRCVQSEGSRFGRPTIAVRTTGCTHRCYFGEGGWCDSWYTSIHPEKGKFCFNDIIKIYEDNPQVKEMMLTGGKVVDEKFIAIHNRKRLNRDAIRKMIDFHKDYHYKPVWDGTEENLKEIEEFRVEMGIPKHKTYVMPAGDTRETLVEMYPKVFEMVAEHGYNMTGRDHIIAYDTERGV